MKVQAAFPEIACFKSDDNSTPYRVFGLNGVGASGKNLLSASWKRSRNEFSGQFNFTIKEDVRLASYSNDTKVKPFLDVVQPMDVVTFKGDSASGKADFIGGGYFTFRIISAKSPAGSWIYRRKEPAKPALDVVGALVKATGSTVEAMVQEGFEAAFK